MKLKFSTIFHLKVDGQTEVVNRSLENLLRTLVDEHIENWDLKLATAKFAYGTSVNSTTGKNSREIIYGFKPKQPKDLISISYHYRASEFASTFTSHVHKLHKKISDKIAYKNANYKFKLM